MSDAPKKDKSTAPGRDKSTSPSRTKRGGGGGRKKEEGHPKRIEREGSRRRHDSVLTPAQRKERVEQRQAARKAEVDSHAAARKDRQSRDPKGLGGRAQRRGR